MTAIWSTDPEGGWKLQSTVKYHDEATLHTLVEQAPQLLPLSGSPRLTIVGREVRLGTGRADLIALEPSGRVVVIEVKLADNNEARQAVVAQVLAYAARLHGLTPSQFEMDVLGDHLRSRGHDSLFLAVTEGDPDQDGAERRSFDEGLAESLAEGRFRLVIVLDAAPKDLVQTIGYLENVSDRLIIDLVTIAAYEVGKTELVVPSRVEPQRFRAEQALTAGLGGDQGIETPGIDEFRKAVVAASVEQQDLLNPLCEWATDLERRRLAVLLTRRGPSSTILRIYVPGDMSLAILNLSATTASVQLFKSVFDKRAPAALGKVEKVIGGPIGQGTAVKDLTNGLLDSLTSAYEEAATGRLMT